MCFESTPSILFSGNMCDLVKTNRRVRHWPQAKLFIFEKCASLARARYHLCVGSVGGGRRPLLALMFCRRRIFTFAFPYIQGPRQRQAGLYMTNLQRILTLDRLGQRQCWDSLCPLVFLPALLRHCRHELVGATHLAGGVVVVVVNVGQTHVLSETFSFICKLLAT